MLPSSRKLWNSKLEIPPLHKFSSKSFPCGRDGDFSKDNNKLSTNGICPKSEINSIDVEIQVNQGQWYLCIFLVLIVLWLPLLLLLLHSHVTLQLEIAQQKGELTLLRAEVETLHELAQSLKYDLLSFPKKHVSDKVLTENVDTSSPDKQAMKYSQRDENRSALLPRKESLSQIFRIKRSLSGESSDEMQKSFSAVRNVEKKLSTRRGKEKCHNRHWQQRRRNCRLHRMHGRKPSGTNEVEQMVHLKGAHPEVLVQSGHVGPWFIDMKAIGNDRPISSFHLREEGESVEVEVKGIYLIYAQMYYLTSHTLNSFSINLLSRNSDSPQQIAVCSANASATSGSSEVSCYTAVARMLQPGDRIFIQQQERNRRLIMRSGHSFLGLVKISTNTSPNTTLQSDVKS